MKNIFLFLACCFLLFSCNKDKNLVSPSQTSAADNDRVLEAKQWFEANYGSGDAGQMAAQNAAANSKTLNWDKAVSDDTPDAQRVYVPLRLTSKRAPAQEERFRLLVKTDKAGKKSAEVVHFIADHAYYQKNKQVKITDFTGLILVSDWNDKFLYGLQYQGGRVTGDVSPVVGQVNALKRNAQGASPVANASAGQDYTIVTVIWYSQACVDGVCTDPVVVGIDTYTVCVSPGGGGGGDGSGGGGGGDGSGGSYGSPAGGGKANNGCGLALVCPDGSENGSVEIIKPLTPNTVLVAMPDHPIVDPVKYMKCFNSTQPATMTVYARQPVPGTADTYKLRLNGAPDVGHTFISITQNGITRVLGFYPTSDVSFVVDAQGIMGDNSRTPYTVSISVPLSPSGLTNVLRYIQLNAGITYKLGDFNCTNFAIEAASAGGLSLPSTPGQWGVGGRGLNPGVLGDQMGTMPLPAGAQRTGAGTAPANAGGC